MENIETIRRACIRFIVIPVEESVITDDETPSCTRGCGAIIRCHRVSILGGVVNPNTTCPITNGMRMLRFHVQ